jgi:GalNAc-alpha-(1->4)-GalNAc-alpha-(1->3)-diNAcBac-PP-undecaprenol alpha-1,4-N-acetyl-D-galactosaminyltransferase
MKTRKLCLIIPSLQAGGMERVMSELAGYFATKENLETHLVLYGKSREIFFSVPDNIIIHKPEFRFNNNLRFLFTLKTIFFLRKTIKQINPESILSFGELWNSFVLLALMGTKYPVNISDRCSPARKYGKFHTFLRKWLYPKAVGIIVQTHKAKDLYYESFKHKNIEVIGNPIRFVKDNSEIPKENAVLMVGRLIQSKHQDKLIELFINIQVPGWKLVLVGYDHLQQKHFERLQEIIRQNKAEDKVFMAGKQADVDKYYNMSKIFAFTSSSEGFPNAIGEAMSAGLPVVAFDCVAGPSEMILDNQNGFLIPLFDYQQFQKKLELLMKDEGTRNSFGNFARKSILEFSMDHIGDKYLQFLFK